MVKLGKSKTQGYTCKVKSSVPIFNARKLNKMFISSDIDNMTNRIGDNILIVINDVVAEKARTKKCFYINTYLLWPMAILFRM